MKENILNNKFPGYRFKSGSYIKLFAICCLLLVFGCKAKKPLVARKPVADTGSAAKAADAKLLKINAIRSAQTAFNTFSGRARATLSINGEGNDVTLNIRIRRDQKIWVSVTAIAGIEVARALITPDSILLINRMQGAYVKQPFSYVSKFAGDKVNYKTLESLMIGNAVPELLNENADFDPENENTALTGNLSGLFYKLLLGPDLRVVQTNLTDQTEGESMQVTNGAFIQAGSRVMPSHIDMSSVVKTKKIQLNLRYIKEDFDLPVEFPFNIPSRYSPSE